MNKGRFSYIFLNFSSRPNLHLYLQIYTGIFTSPAHDSGGARYCSQFVHNVLNSCEFAPTINSRRQMAGSPPNLHTMVPRSACIQSVLKVKVKGHVIRGTFVLAGKSLLLQRK